MYRILIAGCGYAGCAIGSYFRSKNQKVWGIVRSRAHTKELESLGIEPLVCDIEKPSVLNDLPPADFVIISVSPQAGSKENYRKIYLEGIGNLLKAIHLRLRPLLVVHLSSTGVFGEQSGAWVDEMTDPKPDDEKGRILLASEEQTLKSGLNSIVFRLGGIYGPGRNRIQSVREGKLPNETNRFINLIHVEDITRAMPVLFNKAEVGNVYLGVDDEPVLQSELYRHLAVKLNVSIPVFSDSQITRGKRCRNARLKSIGFQFKYPTFREGYESLLP